jgi:cytochrome c peroxidase
MVSFDSPYDRFSYKGDTTAMSNSAKRGLELFFEERIDCHHCHGNFHFSLNLRHERTVFEETGFANNGLYNVNNTGRFVESGPNAGDGRDNPFKSEFVHGFVLTEQERADVMAFLKSLTDETFLKDPKFSNPFAR